MKKLKHGSLFSGIGGFDLAALWAGIETVFSVEWAKFPRGILQQRFPGAKHYEDICKINGKEWFGRVDIISGGFPCQPFSVAGKRQGVKDDRHLWPQMLRVISEARPTWVIAENVAGISTMVQSVKALKLESHTIDRYPDRDISEAVYTQQERMLLDSICEELEEIGYSVQPVIIPAISKGAWHRRDRVWIIANTNSCGK